MNDKNVLMSTTALSVLALALAGGSMLAVTRANEPIFPSQRCEAMMARYWADRIATAPTWPENARELAIRALVDTLEQCRQLP